MAGDNRCEISITAANNAKLEGRCLTQKKKEYSADDYKTILKSIFKGCLRHSEFISESPAH